MKNILILILSALLFTSCGYKNIQDIKKTDINKLNETWKYKSTNTKVPQLIDIQNFTDLRTYLNEVNQQNLDLKTLILTIEIFKENKKIVNANNKPNANFEIDSQRTKNTNRKSKTQIETDIKIDVSWSLDLWGKISDEIEVSKLEQEQKKFNYLHARRVLFSEALLLWIDLATITQKLEFNSKMQRIYKNLVQIAKEKFIKGLDNKENYINYKEMINKLNIMNEELILNKRLAIFKLNILRAKKPNSFLNIKTKNLMEMNIELPSTIEATMLYGRYDILNAYKELEILNKKTRISYKAMLPQITFSTNITNSKQAIDSLSIEETLWQLIGGVTQPIFNAGQLESIAKTKSIESKISLQNYQKTILKALEELEVNLEEKLSLEKRHKILQDNLKLNQEKVNFSKDGYLRSFKTLDEYLLQKIALLEYQEQLKDFEKAYLTNKIKLALIIGYKFENLLKN